MNHNQIFSKKNTKLTNDTCKECGAKNNPTEAMFCKRCGIKLGYKQKKYAEFLLIFFTLAQASLLYNLISNPGNVIEEMQQILVYIFLYIVTIIRVLIKAVAKDSRGITGSKNNHKNLKKTGKLILFSVLLMSIIVLPVFYLNVTIPDRERTIDINIQQEQTVQNGVIEKETIQVIKLLYQDILIDYKNTHINRILQDFGEPNRLNNGNFGDIQHFTLEPDTEYKRYYYDFKNGNMVFHVQKSTGVAKRIEIQINEKNKVGIIIPINNYTTDPLILGHFTFADVFERFQQVDILKHITSNIGGSAGNSQTDFKVDLNIHNQWSKITFWTSFSRFDIEDTYKKLPLIKPTYIFLE